MRVLLPIKILVPQTGNLHIPIPIAVSREHNLRNGDVLQLEITPDGITAEYLRTSKPLLISAQPAPTNGA